LSVQLVTNLADLRDIVPAWDVLARHSLEPNVFYESWMLQAALEQFDTGRVAVWLMWEDSSHARLLGLMPLVREHNYYKCPACHWSNWVYTNCPVGTPLIHRQCPERVLLALFDWLGEIGATVFSLQNVAADGGFFQCLETLQREHGLLLDVSQSWQRLLQHDFTSIATVKSQSLLPGEVRYLEQWMREFVSLEQGGWKGWRQTLTAYPSPQQAFMEDVMRAAALYGQLMMVKLTLHDELIALSLHVTGAAQGVFTLQAAYNAAYADVITAATTDTTHQRQMSTLHLSTSHRFSKPLMHTVRMAKSVYRYCTSSQH
jgi:hypothetical protein